MNFYKNKSRTHALRKYFMKNSKQLVYTTVILDSLCSFAIKFIEFRSSNIETQRDSQAKTF